jgi:DinB family protein
MTVAQVVSGQFTGVWDMVRRAIDQIPHAQWRSGERVAGKAPVIPARTVYHAIEAAEFYAEQTPDTFPWGHRFGVDWEAATPDQLPTAAQARAYLDEVQSRVEAWLSGLDDAALLAPDNLFPWTGGTVLDRALYMLRHTQHHVGEINTELYRRGLPRVKW